MCCISALLYRPRDTVTTATTKLKPHRKCRVILLKKLLLLNFNDSFLSFAIDCDILIAGDDLGRVWIYDVNRCLCESRQGKKLEELKETQVHMWIALV